MARRRRQRKAVPAAPSAPAAPPARRRWIRRWVTAGGLALLAGVGGAAWLCFRHETPRPSVLLITIDTLRADRLGCYGYAKAQTPVLDALAARGVRFPTAVAHVPLTTPSHASILTGLNPPRHGIRDNGGFVLPAGIPTLAESFQRAGYQTAAFVSGFPLDRRFGLGRGFTAYDDRLPHGDDPRRAAYVERRADETTAAVLRWLDGSAPPWLLWVHYFDPHSPYEPPERFRDRLEPYDGEVAFVDEQIGRLLARVEAKGLGARTVVLVTADHGESLGEHGEETHGVFVYDATVRVPWIMAGPGIPSGRTPETVARSVDVAPTLLDLAGLAPLPGLDGRSLRPALRGERLPDRPAYVESLFARLQLGWAPLHGWRTARWKLIDAPRPELYALDADPRETTDRSHERPDLVVSMKTDLRAVLAAEGPRAAATPDAESLARLRALGYLGAGAAPASPALKDPKRGIALINRLEHGIAEARSDPSLAARELEVVLAEDPHIAVAHRYLAIARSAMKDYAGAVQALRALETQEPLRGDNLVLLADCLRLAGRTGEALEAAERAAREQPLSPEAELVRAKTLTAIGRTAEAAEAYARAQALAPGQVEALRGLSDLALAHGDLSKAAGGYREILAREPDDVGAMVKLGVVLVRTEQTAEAIGLFQRAVERAPNDAEALLALAGALARSGRPAEALPYFERAIVAGQRTTVALNGLGFARLESGDRKGALAALRASLVLDPRQPQVAEAVRGMASGRSEPGERP